MTPSRPLSIHPDRRPFQAMIGTGGVGSGIFWELDGNSTLGREESRAGRLLERKDYCKLHIISHYVKVLLGSQFEVIPAGKVGSDAVGRQVLVEMAAAGLNTGYMISAEGQPTLFSVCFVYPDGSGGNLTSNNSASAYLNAADMQRLEGEFACRRGRGIALAAPEVPLEARLRLLDLGKMYQFFRAACLTSEEARSEAAGSVIEKADLLALNLDEAAALAGIRVEESSPQEMIDSVLEKTSSIQPALLLSVTAGPQGSWTWEGSRMEHIPAFPVRAVSTAGAGDAHLAGLLAGMAAGLNLGRAVQLAGLTAAFSVTSPDTIHPGLNCEALLEFVTAHQFELDPEVLACLGQA